MGSLCVLALATAIGAVDDGVRLGAFGGAAVALHRSGDVSDQLGGRAWGGVLVSGVIDGFEVGAQLGLSSSHPAVDAELDWNLGFVAGHVFLLGERGRYHPRFVVGMGALSQRESRSFFQAGLTPTEQEEAVFTRLEALAFSWRLGQARLRFALPTLQVAVPMNARGRSGFDVGLGLFVGAEILP